LYAARADEKVDAMRRARGHQKELIRRGLFRKSACQKTRARAFLANPSFSARENLRDDVGGSKEPANRGKKGAWLALYAPRIRFSLLESGGKKRFTSDFTDDYTIMRTDEKSSHCGKRM
jgi:hypothetical protein